MRLTLVILILTAARLDACSVPVFRYALERWTPSPYPVLVFHDRPLTTEQQTRLDTLKDSKLNIVVRTVAIGGVLSNEERVIHAGRPAGSSLPWASVRYPDSDEQAPAVWSGSLDLLPSSLGDSPARRELVRLLGQGTSIVWFLLDADTATEKMLRDELARLEKTLKLPDVEAADLKSALPLKLSFAVLKIERKGLDADLARELLQSDEDLRDVTGPVIFPVVGRGRMLFALHGKGLTAKEVEQSASFACGACSCRVKELNPGVDLLLRADWTALLNVETDTEEDTPVPSSPAIPIGIFEGTSPQTSEGLTSAQIPESVTAPHLLRILWGIVPAATVAASALGIWWLCRCRKEAG